MPRVYAILFALVGVAWAALTVLTIPDGFPEELDPYGYGLLIAHGVVPSFAVPIALTARARGRVSTSQTGIMLAAPLVGLAVVIVAWSLAGLPSDGLEIAISAGPLYIILGIIWSVLVGIGVSSARMLARWTAA